MKRTAFLLLLFSAFAFAACDGKNDDETTPGGGSDGPIAKYALSQYMPEGAPGGTSKKHSMEVVTPEFDSQNRLVKCHKDYWMPDTQALRSGDEADDFIQTVSEDWVYQYDDQRHTATLWISGESYSYNDGKRSADPYSDAPITLRFDSNWRMTSDNQGKYNYTNDRLASGFIMGDDSNCTWTGGNLTSVGNDRFTYNITYSSEPNPFSFLDFGMIHVLPSDYVHGLMGKVCGNIPDQMTLNYSGDSHGYAVSFTKDKQGRLTQIRFDRLDNAGCYSTVDIEY